jgi:hypothetical protein
MKFLYNLYVPKREQQLPDPSVNTCQRNLQREVLKYGQGAMFHHSFTK